MGGVESVQSTVRLTAVVRGRVQGVGFRYFTAREAERLCLAGTAVNQHDGTVVVTVEGPAKQAAELLSWLESPRAPGAVTSVEASYLPTTGKLRGFHTG